MNRDKTTQVLLITDFRGLIPQRIMNWDGYDLGILQDVLEQGGAEVRILGAHTVSHNEFRDDRRRAAIYTSSQAPLCETERTEDHHASHSGF